MPVKAYTTLTLTFLILTRGFVLKDSDGYGLFFGRPRS